MNTKSTINTILDHFVLLFQPLWELTQMPQPNGLLSYCDELEIDLEGIVVDPDEVAQLLTDFKTIFEAIKTELTDDGISEEDLLKLLPQVKKLIDLFNDLRAVQFQSNIDETLKQFGEKILNNLILQYLLNHQRPVYNLLKFIGIVEEDDFTSIDFSILKDFINDPIDFLKQKYNWNDPLFDANTLLEKLNTLLRSFNIFSYFALPDKGQLQFIAFDPTDSSAPLINRLNIPLLKYISGGKYMESGISLLPYTNSLQQPVISLFIYGLAGLNINIPFNNGWSFNLDANVSSDDFGVDISASGIKPKNISSGIDLLNVLMKASFDKPATSDNKIKLLSILGSDLYINQPSLELNYELDNGEQDAEIIFDLGNCELGISNENEDGFIAKLLAPLKGRTIKFPLAVGYSLDKGFFVKGGEKLAIKIPVNFKLGVLQFTDVILSAESKNDEYYANIQTNIISELGPFVVVIEKIGVKMATKFYGLEKENFSKGNLGPLDLNLGVTPPSGIGLSIDAEGFSGGGYLSIDANTYKGIVQLSFKDSLSFTAIGILTTKSEDSDTGFSLLLLITVEDLSIQLGMGFIATGIGGIIALNRTMNADELRKGVKSGGLNSLMFPQDPLANFNVIINDLEKFFPIQKDRFVFGPMIKIAWGGAKALLELEIGLIFEVPAPVRIAIPGVLRTLIPTKDSKTLNLQVNFLGFIDFGAKKISFDASLFDSRLMNFTLSGDMMFRLCWGAEPNFLFSIGGFHPAFKPPPLGLSKMDRLKISLLDTKKGKVQLTTYFAITSNTVQLGARLDASFKAAKWRAVGMIYFDALFQFNPFSFLINAGAMFAVINKKGKELLAVSLDLALSGPTPWNVKGKATFKLLGIKVKLRFNKTFGERKNTSLPDVEILPLLRLEFEKDENWLALFPQNKHDLVKVKKVENSTDLIVHPVGSFIINQQLVPLKVKLEKFGNQKPKGNNNYFEIESVIIGVSSTISVDKSDVENSFSPGQFRHMSDAQKLSAPSFQKFKSGVRLKGTEDFQVKGVAKRTIEYELILKNDPVFRKPGTEKSIPEIAHRFNGLAKSNNIGKSSLSAKKKGRNLAPEKQIRLKEERYVIVSKDTMTIADFNSNNQTFAEAMDRLNAYEEYHPLQEDTYQVIPAYELDLITN